MRTRTQAFLGLSFALAGLYAWQIRAWAADNPGFPIGMDAVQAAPESHRVIFENALVRVLEVTVPANGKTEPMHYHRTSATTSPVGWSTNSPATIRRGIPASGQFIGWSPSRCTPSKRCTTNRSPEICRRYALK